MRQTRDMMAGERMSVFGPIPSRRLGRSLGINNLGARSCTYSCVYCQAGATRRMRTRRTDWHTPELVADRVARSVEGHRARGVRIDFLTFVPEGEPTLDRGLGKEIRLLRPLGIRVAVITNGSLLWKPEVREELLWADWVSVKVDAVDPGIWHRLNRPHGHLDLPLILSGLAHFAHEFEGTLATETMLVRDINVSEPVVAQTAAFVASLSPAVAYLSIPLRPPAEPWVSPPSEHSLVRAHELFRAAGVRGELLAEHESDDFGLTGSVEQGILNTVAVHPMSEEALAQLLAVMGADRSIMARLISAGSLVPVSYGGRRFVTRKMRERQTP